MGRPKKTTLMISKHISLPEPLNTRLELELWSDAEQRIPFGAQQALIVSLLETHFKRQDTARRKAAEKVAGGEAGGGFVTPLAGG